MAVGVLVDVLGDDVYDVWGVGQGCGHDLAVGLLFDREGDDAANVEVGEGAKVAAGSVVLTDVPPHSTVAGIPAEVVGRPEADQPALEMNSRLGL